MTPPPLRFHAQLRINFALVILGLTPFISSIFLGKGAVGNATSQAVKMALSPVVTGTSNIAGGNFTIQPGNGTGTGGSGSLIFQTAPVAGSSTTPNTMTTALQINPSGTVALPLLTNAGALINDSSGNITSAGVGGYGTLLMSNGSSASFQTVSQGAKNYVQFNNFENNATTGWGLSHTTLLGGAPIQAQASWSSASGSYALSTVNSGQLAGLYSASLAWTGTTTTPGDMFVSQAYAIDTEDQAKVLTFKFYYSATVGSSLLNFSGTSSNTYQVWIYDVANAAWIQPAGVYNLTQGSGVGYAVGTFQAPSNMTSFRLAVISINASTTGSHTLLFDDFSVGPQTAPMGPAMSDLGNTPWTPTGSWSTNTTYTGAWSRVGDKLFGSFNLALAGAPTSASLMINLPAGLTIDTTKMPGFTAGATKAGIVNISAAGSQYVGDVRYNSTTSVSIRYYNSAGSGSPVTTGNVTQSLPNTFANADFVNGTFVLPIVGWSSNTAMSADTDTRVVAARASGTSSAVTVNNPVIFPTTGFDTHGGYNATTGRYTVPVAGIYEVSTNINGSTSIAYSLYKNGSSFDTMAFGDSTEGHSTGTILVQANANDILDIRPSGSTTPSGYLNFKRLSGPAVVAATESVGFAANGASATVTGSLSDITWLNKENDSHGGWNGTTTWTCPVSGRYSISAGVLVGAGTITVGQFVDFGLLKNGSVIRGKQLVYDSTNTTIRGIDIKTDGLALVAGDAIKLQIDSSAPSPVISASTIHNFIGIVRTGN